MRESYQKIRLRLYISWEPGSQVPKEFAALLGIEIVVRATTNSIFTIFLYVKDLSQTGGSKGGNMINWRGAYM